MNQSLAKRNQQQQGNPPAQSDSQQQTFQIMYQALVAIASADAFFGETKSLKNTAAKALEQIGRLAGR